MAAVLKDLAVDGLIYALSALFVQGLQVRAAFELFWTYLHYGLDQIVSKLVQNQIVEVVHVSYVLNDSSWVFVAHVLEDLLKDSAAIHVRAE